MTVYFQNIETLAYYQISGNRVLRWFEDKCQWRRSEHLRPADMAHYPFIGVRNSTFC